MTGMFGMPRMTGMTRMVGIARMTRMTWTTGQGCI